MGRKITSKTPFAIKIREMGLTMKEFAELTNSNYLKILRMSRGQTKTQGWVWEYIALYEENIELKRRVEELARRLEDGE